MARGIAAVLAFLSLAWPTGQAVADSGGKIVVRVRPGTSDAALRSDLAAHGLLLGRHIPHTRDYAVGTPRLAPADAVRVVRDDRLVAAAEPDHLLHEFEVPNDPYVATAGSYLSTIRLPQAWDVSHGSLGVVIAVVDTGVSSVGDLSTQVLPGRTFVSGTADAHDDSVIGHGTLVAGVAAATTNNGVGIAGAAWNASVLPVKVLDSRGAGTDSQVAAGIVWAADHGADVINLSLGGPTSGQVLCDSVAYAQSRDVLVVASAGNGSNGRLNYPAACANVVAVSATDANGDFASFSSYGPDVGLAAPGISVTSTRNDNHYGTESGTSLSAPMVSGVAALVVAEHPEWSAAQVAEQLEETAQDRGPRGVDVYYGHGLLDAYAALGGPMQAPDFPKRDALEPNDDGQHATQVQKTSKATIAPEGDVDWYAVDVRWPARVRFDVAARPYDAHTGPNLRPVVELYDADLDRLARVEADSERARLAFRLAAGLYYVRIANGCGARSAGTYSVSFAVRRSRGIAGKPLP
jgi:subtilisin family serine protease